MMTSREIVRRAVEFRNPERLPMWQGVDPEMPNDLAICFCLERNHTGRFLDHRVPMDDWGCRWERADSESMGQTVGHPLSDWKALDRWTPPDPVDLFYFEGIEDAADGAGDLYLGVSMGFNLTERHRALRGFENAMMDYYLEPERTAGLLDLIADFRIAQIEEIARRCGDRVDGVFLTDDWGTQLAAFVSVEVFDEFFRERYRRMAAVAHDKGMHLHLHSCGRINDLVPSMIDAGIDSLGLGQPLTNGIREMGELGRGNIAFGVTVDIQKTLPTNDPDLIRREAFELVDHWGTADGGLLVTAGAFGDVTTESIVTTVRAFMDASRALGKPRGSR